MPDLQRLAIESAFRATHSANPGLLLAKGLQRLEDGNGGNGPDSKTALIQRIARLPCSNSYRMAYDRWSSVTSDHHRFNRMQCKVEGRLLIGVSASNSLETSITLSHVHGMPYIPGSSVKGAARHYAEDRKLSGKVIAALFGSDKDVDDVEAGAGCVIWHDAWFVPEQRPFSRDIVTVHHPKYYAGNEPASEMDSPIPNALLGTSGKFLFVLEGPRDWTDTALRILRDTLMHRGVGAKTAAGYGVLTHVRPNGGEASALQSDFRETLRDDIAKMDEKALVDAFGAKRKGTISKYAEKLSQSETDIEAAAKDIVLAKHRSIVDGWSGVGKKQDKGKFKAYQFFAGTGSDDGDT